MNKNYNQTNHKYQYKYNPVQYTNQDILFTTPILETSKTIDGEKSSQSSKSSKSGHALPVSISSKTIKDNASKIEGFYVGTGTLKQGNEVIEAYDNITITVKKKKQRHGSCKCCWI